MINTILAKIDKLDRKSVAILSLITVFFIVILVNKVFGLFSTQIDVTENNVHTLAPGTKKVLGKLESPVTIRYYVTDSADVMSPSEIQLAKRIEEKLESFVKAAPTNTVRVADPESGVFKEFRRPMLTVEKLNPAPDTDAEDLARLDGIQELTSSENNSMYLGIAVKCVDQTKAIPVVQDEGTLEYKLISAVAEVSGGSDKIVRILTSLQVSGGMGANFQSPPRAPWVFYSLTDQNYVTEVLSPSVTEIPEDTSCLVVLHPNGLSDQTQFAIDQYLLKGGSVMVMVDPNFFHARALGGGQPMMPGMPPQQGPPPSSELNTLFEAWGVKYDPTQVLADINYASEVISRGNFSPLFLTLNRTALSAVDSDITTSRLQHLDMLTPGGFDITEQEGIKVDTLVQSSNQSQFVSSFEVDPSPNGTKAIRNKYKPSNTNFSLVARLHGSFKTAFPKGDPSLKDEASEDEPESEKGKEEGAKDDESKDQDVALQAPESLQKSSTPGTVILFADVDFIFDSFCVDMQEVPGFGRVVIGARNENLSLMQNAIDQLAGDSDLIDVRSRRGNRRPFDRPNDWKIAAEKKYQPELDAAVKTVEAKKTELGQLLASQPGSIGQPIMTQEVESKVASLNREIVAFNTKARELRREINKEAKRKQNTIKAMNIGLMPVLIVIAGIALAIYRKTRTAAR